MSELLERAREDEADFISFLEALMEIYDLEGAALGIAKQAITRGLDSLSDRQLKVLDLYVISEHCVDRCDRCSAEIDWSEMLDAMSTKRCGWCENQVQKTLAE